MEGQVVRERLAVVGWLTLEVALTLAALAAHLLARALAVAAAWAQAVTAGLLWRAMIVSEFRRHSIVILLHTAAIRQAETRQ
jgi:hypothetical protein